MTNTLRGRLSLWYMISVGVVIFLLIAAVSGLFWTTLQDQIDHHVHIAVNEAKQIVENYRGEERDGLIKNLVSGRGMTVVVLSPDGAPVLETNSPDVALVTEHELQKVLTDSSLYDTNPTHFSENNIRFAALPVTISAGKGIVAVGYSTQVLYDTFFRMLGIVAAILFFLVIPITYIGYQLMKRLFKPLEDVAVQAKSVTDSRLLGNRIKLVSPTQELRTIQEAFNTMLDQLEHIFENEREFFSDAAHTLKTPLAVLRSQAENANMTTTKREEMLKTIDQSTDTINDLLLLSRISNRAQKSESVSISGLLSDLSELTATLGEAKHLQITSDIQKDITIAADKQLLQRALSNIVYNAVSYNRSNGKIHISLHSSNGHIHIAVEDSGIGISKRDLASVFSRFYRGRNTVGKGTGLGLAISKSVIEHMGGHISIESTLNKGTTVIIYLP